MSHIIDESVRCPACGHIQSETLFLSLNGERIPAQVQNILGGDFERTSCSSCQSVYQPEHRMLFAHFSLRLWVVMLPCEQRSVFASLEVAIAQQFAHEFASAPSIVQSGLRGTRASLVFGQHFLAEQVRLCESGIEAAKFECFKMRLYLDHLAQLAPLGPVELCFEGFTTPQELRFGVYALGTSRRLTMLCADRQEFSVFSSACSNLEVEYPELYNQPYVSATRYLFSPHLPRPAPAHRIFALYAE